MRIACFIFVLYDINLAIENIEHILAPGKGHLRTGLQH